MSNDLMIPDKSSVPSFLVDAVAAAQNYADASAGISGGFPAKVKLSGKQFTLVDEGGEEKPYPPAALVADAEGNVYLPAIMLAASSATPLARLNAGSQRPAVQRMVSRKIQSERSKVRAESP